MVCSFKSSRDDSYTFLLSFSIAFFAKKRAVRISGVDIRTALS
ncbi:hypothetical protein [Nonlabens xylanidelens]|nr:hypothetical protein [Nonlabens xylanidelens]